MRRFGIGIVIIAVLVVLVASLGHLVPAQPKSKSDKLNIILISVDSVRADHMSLYGYTRQTTPLIDAWAKNAVVFDNFFSTSFLTPISEMSIHTGDYPFTNGVINFQSVLKPDVATLAEILKAHGYRTAAFGTSPEFTATYPSLGASFSRGFDSYQQADVSKPFFGRGDVPVEAAQRWMSSATNSAPFFLWLHISTAHWPYGKDAPAHFTNPSYSGFLATSTYDTFQSIYGYLYQDKRYSVSNTPKVVGAVSPADVAYVNGRYDDGILEMDGQVGALLGYLHESGFDNNTVVVIESEHGESLGERGYIAHYDIYDEQVHTPLIIYIPGMRLRRVDALVSGVDVLPTLLDVLQIPPPTLDGANFLPYLAGASPSKPRNEVFLVRTPLWERVTATTFIRGQAFVAADDSAHYYDTAIRTEQWKLIHRLSRNVLMKYGWWGILTGNPVLLPEYELYDMKVDPQEKTNVYDVHKKDASIVELQKKLASWEVRMKKELPGPTPQSTEIQPYF